MTCSTSCEINNMDIISNISVDEDQIQPHAWSLVVFYQDDGFGNTIDTFNLCMSNKDIGMYVSCFIADEFSFNC